MFIKIKNFLKSIFLIDLLKGLVLTIKYFFLKKVTILYPEEKTPSSKRFKGLHALCRDENGKEKCIACKLCEASCPALAIKVEALEKEDGTKMAEEYEIDLFKCIFCGFCEEVCPVNAIVETNFTEYHFTKSSEKIINKEKLLKMGEKHKTQITISKKGK